MSLSQAQPVEIDNENVAPPPPNTFASNNSSQTKQQHQSARPTSAAATASPPQPPTKQAPRHPLDTQASTTTTTTTTSTKTTAQQQQHQKSSSNVASGNDRDHQQQLQLQQRHQHSSAAAANIKPQPSTCLGPVVAGAGTGTPTTATTTMATTTTTTTSNSHQLHQHQNRMQPDDCQSAILNYQQVRRLHLLMDQRVPIHGRGSFPALQVRLRDLICRVTQKLRAKQINIRDIRLNGGGASYVLAPEKAHYNDLDLIFATDLSDESKFDVIRDTVLDCLRELHIEQHSATTTTTANTVPDNVKTICAGDAAGVIQGDASVRMIGEEEKSGKNNNKKIDNENDKKDVNQNNGADDTSIVDNDKGCQMPRQPKTTNSNLHNNQNNLLLSDCAIKEAYVHKMVKVNDEDRWSLISLGVHQSDAYVQQQQQPQQQHQYQHNNNHHHQMIYHQQQQHHVDGRTIQHQKHSEVEPAEMNDEYSSASSVCSSTYSASTASSASSRCSSTSCSSVSSSIFSASSLALNGNNRFAQNYYNNHNYQHHQSPNNTNNNNNYQTQQRQFPNSIELKFVDRMRRKFEFSVDSFQIILDSLMDFYQFAPQPTTTLTATSNRLKKHPSTPTTIINNCKNQQRKSSINDNTNTGKLNENKNYHHHGSPPNSHSNNHSPDQWTTSSSSSNVAASTSVDVHIDNLPEIANNPTSQTLSHRHNLDKIEEENKKKKLVVGNDANVVYDKDEEVNVQLQVDEDDDVTIDKVESQANYTTAYEDHHSTNCQNSLKSTAATNNNDENASSSRSESSSSGCSSSSSVVSSSSSSLSYEDDEEGDLENVDAFSTASSSKEFSSSIRVSKQTTTATKTPLALNKQISFKASQDGSTSKTTTTIRTQLDANRKVNSINVNKNNDDIVKKVDEVEEKEEEEAVEPEEEEGPSATTNSELSSSHHSFNESYTQQKSSTNQHNIRMSYPVISENFYPTVVGRSEYGNFNEAMHHLEKKLIATRNPEQIRGGGLLKYCNLLVKNYKPTNLYQIRKLERYMCSRFFIDFCDLNQQQAKLESYLANHFSNDPILKFDYLTILHNVVQRSTVCLMNHELRVTLNMIRDLAYKLNDNHQSLIGPEHHNLNDQQQHQQTAMMFHQHQHQQQQHNQQQHQMSSMEMYNNFQLVHQQQHHQHQQRYMNHKAQHQGHQQTNSNNKSSQRQHNNNHHQQRNNENNPNSTTSVNGTNVSSGVVANPMITANSSLPATFGPHQQQTTVNYFEHQRPPVILQSGVYRVKMVIA